MGLSDGFLTRIAKGKGRVILSACGTNEVASESAEWQHGIFTYLLLKGLRGEADYDRDGFISISEIYQYLAQSVPDATQQTQHPMKKGEESGVMFIGRVRKR